MPANLTFLYDSPDRPVKWGNLTLVTSVSLQPAIEPGEGMSEQSNAPQLSLREQVVLRREQERSRRYDEVSEQARAHAEALYRKGKFLCSEAVFTVVNNHLGQPATPVMVKMASGFPVGIGCSGCICGAVAGGVMALGLDRGREKPGETMPDDMFPLSAELHDRFARRNKYICCRKLIKHLDFGSREHKQQCIRFTGEVAADVIDLLEYGTDGYVSADGDVEATDCGGCDSTAGYRTRSQPRGRLARAKALLSRAAGR